MTIDVQDNKNGTMTISCGQERMTITINPATAPAPRDGDTILTPFDLGGISTYMLGKMDNARHTIHLASLKDLAAKLPVLEGPHPHGGEQQSFDVVVLWKSDEAIDVSTLNSALRSRLPGTPTIYIFTHDSRQPAADGA